MREGREKRGGEEAAERGERGKSGIHTGVRKRETGKEKFGTRL